MTTQIRALDLDCSSVAQQPAARAEPIPTAHTVGVSAEA